VIDMEDYGKSNYGFARAAAQRARSEEAHTNALGKVVYELYGEYLANIRQPFPDDLVPRRAEEQGGDPA
jgi:hypothetical protein